MTGSTAGLSTGDIREIEKLQRRRVPAGEIADWETLKRLAGLSVGIGRQLGLLVDRRGGVAEVIVGEAERLELPLPGRLAHVRGRFRGLRLIHTHLKQEPLTREDLLGLSRLRLDLVAAVTIGDAGLPDLVHYGYLLPPAPGNPEFRLEQIRADRLDVDFPGLIGALEEEFERLSADATPTGSDRTRGLLVHVTTGRLEEAERSLDELAQLADTAGIRVVGRSVQRRRQLDPATLLGRGMLQNTILECMRQGAGILVVDRELSPAQMANITEQLDIPVVDRNQLILDIFAQHATTVEGRLQVELAQLRYLMPRLARTTLGLSRLTGGIGGRGPGETKLELDRRRIRDRIRRLKDELDRIRSRRATKRKRRSEARVPVVSIVGYTNAGKSTLVNAITRAGVRAEDRLFVTLDPVSRRMRFPEDREIVFTDTVGFIHELPETLKEAFRATLEELEFADLLLHVVDAADPHALFKKRAVEVLLDEMGVASTPTITVFNKIDRADRQRLDELAGQHEGALFVSAVDRESVRPLIERLHVELFSARAAATRAVRQQGEEQQEPVEEIE